MKRKTLFLLVPTALAMVTTPNLVRADDSALLDEAVRKEATAGAEDDVHRGEMDGAAPEEAIVIVREPGRPATFLAAIGGKVTRKPVKLAGLAETVSVAFHPFAEGRSLAQVSAGRDAASVLLSWNGKKLEVLWESGRTKAGESRWFELDDLDHDGVREIITYQRAELDIDTDDEIGETSTGTSAESLGPTSVLRWNDGKWREDRDALNALR